MGFTGVKQPEFDTLVAKHTAAVGQLKDLARQLHGELKAAGLDTTPAVRIEALAKRASAQAEDLRRRQKLIQEMAKHRIIFDDCRTTGTVFAVPDSIKAAEGLLNGTLAANEALAAAGGDAKALKRLQAYAAQGGNPEFSKVFLKKLGAKGATELPGTLAKQLHDALHKDDKTQANEISGQAKQAMKLLATAMAKATDPNDPAFLGEEYLAELAKQGRAEHTADGITYSGYQAQALIWRASDGKPPFSKRFMEVIGGDAIALEKELYAGRWKASKDLGWKQLALPDLSGVLGLGAAMDPRPPKAFLGSPPQSTVVGDLFRAVANPGAAQALLGHTPTGWKQSVLAYLLSERVGAFHASHDRDPFLNAVTAATTGHDATSKKLAADMIKTLADQSRASFETGDDGNIAVKDSDSLAQYDFLRYPLAQALAANMDEISDVFLNHATFGKAAETDLDYALVLATADDKGLDLLVRTQTEHMRKAFKDVPPVGLNASNLDKYGYTKSDLIRWDNNGTGVIDRSDVTDWLCNKVTDEGIIFRHILETRRHALISANLDAKKADEKLKAMVQNGIGMIPFPGSKAVGNLAPGVFGDLMSNAYDSLASAGYDQIAKYVAKAMGEQGKTIDETWATVATNAKAVERIMEQMIAATMLNNGSFDHAADQLKGRTFVTGDVPPKIVPFDQMSPAQYADFLRWARRNGGVGKVIEWADQVIDRGNEVRDNLNLPHK